MLLSAVFRRNNSGEMPRWARDVLSSPPERGTGLNRWLMRAAIVLRRCGRSDHEISPRCSQ